LDVTAEILRDAWIANYSKYQAYFREYGDPATNRAGQAKQLVYLKAIESEMDRNNMDPANLIKRRQEYAEKNYRALEYETTQ